MCITYTLQKLKYSPPARPQPRAVCKKTSALLFTHECDSLFLYLTNADSPPQTQSYPQTKMAVTAALDISTGPAQFSDRRTSSGQYISSFTGPYGPPRYMSGQQISNSAGPNDDKSQYVLFAGVPAPHLGSFRAVILLQRDASVARVGVGHVNQAH